MTMIKGMAGLNGLSLPLTAQPVFALLPFKWLPDTIVFQGLIPNGALTMNPLVAVLFILIGQAIVWGLPNMHQLMCRFDTVTEDLVRSKIRVEPTVFCWHLSSANAVLMGLLFFMVIVAMATNKPSTFLYYQF